MKKIILGIIILLVLGLAVLFKFYSPRDLYIKYQCAGKLFSCEQNLSDECVKDGFCINTMPPR